MALRSPLTVQPYDYIADSNGRPLDYGQVYIGVANQDPEFYQIPVYLDAAMTKPIDQPIRTNDGFVDFAGSLSELYASAEVYSVKVLDKQGRKVLYKGDMTRKNLMSDALADLNQSIIDMQATAQITLNAAVNSANTEVAQTVSSATAAIDTATTKSNKAATDADAAIKTLFENGGLPATPFKTKALMESSGLVDGKYAMVTDDSVAENNGLYVKTAGAWVKSDYDPLEQAKSYTDSEKTSAINTAAADATTKASAAKTEAIASAAIDAENIAKAEVSKIAEFDSAGNNAYIFTDKNNTVLANLNSNAEFESNDFVTPNGTLNGALIGSAELKDAGLSYAFTDVGHKILWGLEDNADVVSPYPPLQGMGVDAVRGKVLDNDSLNTAGAYLDRVASKNMKPINFDVLVAVSEEDGRGHCRIGSIHQINETRYYVAYIQYEVVGGEVGGRFRAKFIDVDFDNETAVVGEVRKLPQFEGEGTVGAGNSHFLTNKDEVILILHQNAELVTLVSYDECMTWTEVGRYSPKPSTFWMGLDSVTKIPDGQYKDRIVVGGFVSYISDDGQFGLQSIYSDDFGRTWEVGYRFDPQTIGWGTKKNETSVTTDCNNDLIFIVRDETLNDTSMRKMFFGKSKDGGKTFTVFNPEKDTFAGSCPFGVAQAAPHVWDGIPKVLVSHPTKHGRWGLKLYISYNGCYSWATGFQLVPEEIFTGYTYVNAFTSQFFGVVYEHGSLNRFSSISVRFINTGAIYNDTNI